MAQFLVLAHDGTDAGAEARRAKTRPLHAEYTKPFIDRGCFLNAAHLLGAEGQVIGSSSLVEFPTRADLDVWLREDPYVRDGVWQRVDVLPAREVAIPKPEQK